MRKVLLYLRTGAIFTGIRLKNSPLTNRVYIYTRLVSKLSVLSRNWNCVSHLVHSKCPILPIFFHVNRVLVNEEDPIKAF